MTISYTAHVATSSFSCFLKLLARWRGSIYKLLWRDFALFAGIYFLLSFIYRFAMNAQQRKLFELISHYCDSNNALIPVAFVLGFYVSLIMSRWWGALNMIPWPDHMAMYVTANVQDLRPHDRNGRLIRRTMLRYFCLAYVMTMTCISTPVKKRFPSYEHMVQAGLMTKDEHRILDNLSKKNQQFFIPLGWTTMLVNQARLEHRIKDDYAQKTLIDEINSFRMHLATLMVYDMVTVPLVYTQVVTIAVYMFFVARLMGRQFLGDNPAHPDLFFPLFTFLEYFFYMGWLKVAECLVNPFGEDEDDFEINYLIDRNLQVAYLLVDEIREEFPRLERDHFQDNIDVEMPYTRASLEYKSKQNLFMGSTADVRVPQEEREAIPMEPIEEGDDSGAEDAESGHGIHAEEPDPRSKRLSSARLSLFRQPSVESTSFKPGTSLFTSRSSINKRQPPLNNNKQDQSDPIAVGGADCSPPGSPTGNSPTRDQPQEMFEMDLDPASEMDAFLDENRGDEVYEMKPLTEGSRIGPVFVSPTKKSAPQTVLSRGGLLSQSPRGEAVGYSSSPSTAQLHKNLYTLPEATTKDETTSPEIQSPKVCPSGHSPLTIRAHGQAAILSQGQAQVSPAVGVSAQHPSLSTPTTGGRQSLRLAAHAAAINQLSCTPPTTHSTSAVAAPVEVAEKGSPVVSGIAGAAGGRVDVLPSHMSRPPPSPNSPEILLSPEPKTPVWVTQPVGGGASAGGLDSKKH